METKIEKKLVIQIEKKLKDLIVEYCDKTAQRPTEYIRNLVREDLIKKGIINIKEVEA